MPCLCWKCILDLKAGELISLKIYFSMSGESIYFIFISIPPLISNLFLLYLPSRSLYLCWESTYWSEGRGCIFLSSSVCCRQIWIHFLSLEIIVVYTNILFIAKIRSSSLCHLQIWFLCCSLKTIVFPINTVFTAKQVVFLWFAVIMLGAKFASYWILCHCTNPEDSVLFSM